MFYAHNILLTNSPGQEGARFYQALKNVYQIELSGSETRIFEENLKGSVALTESKMFYTSLLKRINNKSISLNEVFSVISVFELEISRQTWYQSKYGNLEEFLEGYNIIQEEFFGVLSINSGISIEEIKHLYYLYNANYSQEGVDVSFLSDKENTYLKYIVTSRTGNKKDAILKIYEDNYGETLQLN